MLELTIIIQAETEEGLTEAFDKARYYNDLGINYLEAKDEGNRQYIQMKMTCGVPNMPEQPTRFEYESKEDCRDKGYICDCGSVKEDGSHWGCKICLEMGLEWHNKHSNKVRTY